MSSRIAVFPYCPHCRAHAVIFYLQSTSNYKDVHVSFLTCGNCGHGICAESEREISMDFPFSADDFSKIFPEPESTEAPCYTPADVADDFEQAKFNLLNEKYKAACIMAGSAVETACVQFGAVRGGLKEKIEKLFRDGVVTTNMADWASEVRGIRVDAAHAAERQVTPTREDAEDAVYFAEMLLTYLYTLPGMIEQRRKKP